MANKKTEKNKKDDIDKELDGLIEQNENMAKGIKKIISSFEKNNLKKNK
jgi:hypothetical protein